MEIVIKSKDRITTFEIDDKDHNKLVEAIYWWMRDDKIIPIVKE